MKKRILFAASILCAVAGMSQDTISSTMNEVIITANRFPNKTSQTAKVVTLITKEQIAQSGAKDISQLLTEQAGLYINGANSNPGKDKSVYLRGAKVDHTLITIDGIPVYDPSGIGSNFDIRWLSIDNIERIEILKGSQSTLYGSDAIAGVINLITKKPDKKPISFSGNVQYGSYQTLHANTGISGTRKKLNYQLNYSYFQSKGINEATDTTSSVNNEDNDGYTKQNFFAALGYAPNNKISIQPSLRISSFQQQYDQGSFLDEQDLTADNRNLQAGLKNEFQIGKVKLHVNYNYNVINRTYIDDSTKSRNGFNIYSKGAYQGHEHFADAFALYPVNEQLKLTGGLEWKHSDASEKYESIGYFGPYNSELGPDSLRQTQLSAYLSGLYQIKKNWNIEAGTRLNHHSAYGSKLVYNINSSYLIDQQWKIFGNISTAFKTPSLYQLYSEYGNKKLLPESGITWEGGFQFHDKKNKTDIRLTYFDRKVKDLIFFYYNPVTWESFYINQDQQHDYGAELELKWNIGQQTKLIANLSYVDGKITTIKNDKDTSFFNLFRRPKFSGGFSISHRFKGGLMTSISSNYFGERIDITYDNNFNEVAVKLKPYFLLNVYAEYPFYKKHFKAFVDLKNLTNTQYSEVYGFNTMGFNAYAGLRFNF